MPPILRPLATPSVAWLWGGLAFSAIGDQLFNVVLGWLAASLFGDNAGLLAAAQAALMLAISLFAGQLLDLLEHRNAMIAADLLRASVLGLMVLIWLALGAPPGFTLVVAVLALAVGNAMFRPSLMAVVPQLAPPTMLPATNALIDTTERIARLLGPGLIGMLAAALPLVHFVTIDVITFAVSALAVSLSIARTARPAERPAPRSGLWDKLSRGFIAVRRDRLLGFELSVTGVINGGWYACFFIGLPLMLVQGHVAGGIGAFGTVISAYGLTNLASTLVVGNRPVSRRPAQMIFSGNAALGTGILLTGLCGWLLPASALLAGFVASAMIAAIGGPMHDITVATRRQMVLAPGEIATGTRAFVVMNQGGLLIGLLASPLLFAAIGVAPTVILAGLCVLGVSAAGFWRFR